MKNSHGNRNMYKFYYDLPSFLWIFSRGKYIFSDQVVGIQDIKVTRIWNKNLSILILIFETHMVTLHTFNNYA